MLLVTAHHEVRTFLNVMESVAPVKAKAINEMIDTTLKSITEGGTMAGTRGRKSESAGHFSRTYPISETDVWGLMQASSFMNETDSGFP